MWSPSFFFADSEGGKLFIESQTKRVTAPFFFFVFFKMSQLIKNVIIIKKGQKFFFFKLKKKQPRMKVIIYPLV